MAVELVGYKPIVKNSIYVSDAGGSASLSKVLFLGRFREPSEEQVLRLIKRTIKMSLEDRLSESKQNCNLSNVLDYFSRYTLQRIARGNKKLIGSLRENLKTSDGKFLSTANNNLVIYCGVVSKGSISKDVSRQGLNECYRAVSLQNVDDNRLGWKFKARMLLNNFELPDRSIIEFLVREGTLMSDRFQMDGECKYFTSVIEKIYRALPDANAISKLPDFSKKTVIDLATYAVYRLANSVKEAAGITREIEDKIRQGLRNVTDLHSEKGLFGEN